MKTFSANDIDAIMLDIECLDLPDQFKFPVLQLVLGTVEDLGVSLHCGIDFAAEGEERTEMTGGRAASAEDVPEFLKSMADRDIKDVLADMEPEPEVLKSMDPQPRTSVAPQAAFSPAPVPEVEPKKPEASPAHRARWTEEEEAVLIKGRLKGKSFKELTEVLGRKECTCASKMHWLTKNHPERIECLKAEMGLPATKPTTLSTGPWTANEEIFLTRKRALGESFKAIALKLNRPVKGVTQKFYNLRDAAEKPSAAPAPKPAPKPASKQVGKITSAAPALASKAEGGKGVLPRPCPDKSWPIEDDLDLVSEHHRGLSMLDVSITLERTKPDCVKRYNALMDAMPAGPFTERQAKLKQTLAHHAQLARKAA